MAASSIRGVLQTGDGKRLEIVVPSAGTLRDLVVAVRQFKGEVSAVLGQLVEEEKAQDASCGGVQGKSESEEDEDEDEDEEKNREDKGSGRQDCGLSSPAKKKKTMRYAEWDFAISGREGSTESAALLRPCKN